MTMAHSVRAKNASYVELEIFLAQTQKEIGDAFDNLVYGDATRKGKVPPRNGPSPWSPISSSPSPSPARCPHCGRQASPSTIDAGSEMSSSLSSCGSPSPPPAVPPRRGRGPRAFSERCPRSLSVPPPQSFWNTYPPVTEAPPVPHRRLRHRKLFRNVTLPSKSTTPPRYRSTPSWTDVHDENMNPNRFSNWEEPAVWRHHGHSRTKPELWIDEIRHCDTSARRIRHDNWDWRSYRSPPSPPLRGASIDQLDDMMLHWCSHCCSYLQCVEQPAPPRVQSVTWKKRACQKPPEAVTPCPEARWPRPSTQVDVDQLTAFVDSMVNEVNSLTIDGGQTEPERSRDLATFAGRFPKPELRQKQPAPLPPKLVSPSSPLRDEFLEDEVFEGEPVETPSHCVGAGLQHCATPDEVSRNVVDAGLHQRAPPEQTALVQNGHDQNIACLAGNMVEHKSDKMTIKLVQDGAVITDTTIEIQAPPGVQPELTIENKSTTVGADPGVNSIMTVVIQEPHIGKDHAQSSELDDHIVANFKDQDDKTLDLNASEQFKSVPRLAEPLMASSPKYDQTQDLLISTKPPGDSGTLQKSRNVGEFMRQLETSIRESSSGNSVRDTDDCDTNSMDSYLQRLMIDAITQTSPGSLSPAVSSTWFYECVCGERCSDGDHRPSSWLEESVNDQLSTLGGATPADSAEELEGSRPLEHRSVSVSASISDLEMETSSSYSLSESLDNLTAGGGSSAISSTASSSSTLGSPEHSVWVLRTSCVDQVPPPSKRPSNPVALDFETYVEPAWNSSAPSGGGSCDTLVSTTPTIGDSRCRSRESTPDSVHSDLPTSKTELPQACDTGSLKAVHVVGEEGATKFGTVPISKPKTTASCVIGAHSSPGFACKFPTNSVAQTSSAPSTASPLSPWVSNDVWSDMNKSSSAPVLGEREHRREVGVATFDDGGCSIADADAQPGKVFMAPRSQSAKEISELEAVEACKWLRATGFPQYAQMFEDLQFPIDISSVHKDHYFLDQDSLQSLFRRLNALNRCARMRLDNLPRKISADDSDDENQCALSENWKFQRQSRRWSRIPGNFEAELAKRSGSRDECETGDAAPVDSVSSPPTSTAAASSTAVECTLPTVEDGSRTSPLLPETGLKRSGSERFKDGAKAFLRRVESLKSRRSKRKNREAVVISGPQLLDVPGLEEQELCVQITPPATPASPICSSSPSPNSPSDVSQNGTPPPTLGHRLGRRPARQFFGSSLHCRGDGEICALSDSECSPTLWRSGPTSPTGAGGDGGSAIGSRYIENFLAPDSPLPSLSADDGDGINYRTGSFNLGLESATYRERFQKRGNKRSASGLDQDQERHSLYDNVPVVIFNKGYTDENGQPLHEADIFKNITSLNTAFGRRTNASDQTSDDRSSSLERAFSVDTDVESGSAASASLEARLMDQDERTWDRRDSGVGLSLTRSERWPPNWQTDPRCHRPSIPCRSVPLNELTCSQMMVIRKLALLKLTALMERYSPSNRSGWNWAMPKFIKRMKTPDYKDKTVFGVPLVVVLQRTGHPLPSPVQEALRFVRKTAIDAVGIFRKSGVRSRIQKLKNLTEVNPAAIDYDDQQPYDVADLIKQYFRDLPEALLTNKMSETFTGIYQHIEPDVRLEALQAAVVLMPDENREVLQALLSFLKDVSNHSNENQMPASNLAVCFAPSLFHLSGGLRSQSTSPRRRRPAGVPDQRELNENRAAHECLAHMIRDFGTLFSIPDDILAQCRCPYMVEQWLPPTIDEICHDNEWKTMVEASVQWLLKEAREKFKGWVSVSAPDGVELAYRKLGDGNPLRIWKVSVEVEAPPFELLQRVLRERHLWDPNLVKWRTIDRLDKQTEIFQYVCSSMTPLPVRDYCVLRSWKTDFPKGTCVLVETSVDHPEATPLLGGVRGIVLASRYLIEPCGSGKSRVTHVSRIDTRGRSPDWYHKAYGHISTLYLARLRDSVQHAADGPESKV